MKKQCDIFEAYVYFLQNYCLEFLDNFSNHQFWPVNPYLIS